jgi:hypothetical protein
MLADISGCPARTGRAGSRLPGTVHMASAFV